MTKGLEENETMTDTDLTLTDKWIDNAAKHKIWVKGMQITSKNASDVLGDGTVSLGVKNGDYTLTLRGVNMEYISSDPKANNDSYTFAAIYCEGNLTIQLESETTNNITNSRDVSVGRACGIYFLDGDLTIKGEGILNVTGGTGNDSYGICVKASNSNLAANGVYGNVNIENGTITAEGGEAKSNSAIHAAGYITISGGIVEATAHNASNGYSRGIWSPNLITISGGTVIAEAGMSDQESYGIEAFRISINGGNVIASGNSSALYKYNNESNAQINISNQGSNVIRVGAYAENAVNWDTTTSLDSHGYFYYGAPLSGYSLFMVNPGGALGQEPLVDPEGLDGTEN
ncbi:protein of unknown function [Lutispora thermophila DSM 19022]|uniref:Uncharacterized protein n=2 Tax=Lutispora TaxID=667112 RepID=A0A1M6EUM3_9FIRM|nr:protein of unknown function [Lutispora thermophila DSM 19022]